MLLEKQILEIREHLERAKSPLFFYDNDVDGFCSYVLLRKFIDRGKGIAVRSHPDIDEDYAKKAQELGADYIFVLDRPILGEKFVEEIRKLQLPIVWIDHHDVYKNEKYENVFLYNPRVHGEYNNEPTSYWSYLASNRKEDMWISLIGCIADHYLPEFADDFKKMHPEYWNKNVKVPFDVYYKSEIGKLARVISFGLKDSVSHVVQLQNFVISCRNPGEFFEELEGSKPFVKKYKEILKKYEDLIKRAKENSEGKIVFFNYSGDLSISSDIANELSYLYQGKIIVVAYTNGPITNISLRGKNVKKIIEEIIPSLEGATGGGHTEAVGMRIQSKDLERFKKEVEERL